VADMTEMKNSKRSKKEKRTHSILMKYLFQKHSIIIEYPFQTLSKSKKPLSIKKLGVDEWFRKSRQPKY
jgi:hypothetical protein